MSRARENSDVEFPAPSERREVEFGPNQAYNILSAVTLTLVREQRFIRIIY